MPNFVGVKEASFNSEKFLEISRAALAMRPDFAMLTGVEYLLPSVPLGGIGSYSAAGSICPSLCSQLFDACMRGDWPLARELQYKISWLWLLFRDQYPSSLKGGMVMMGRPVGPTRAPLPTATAERQAHVRSELNGSAFSRPSRTAGDRTSPTHALVSASPLHSPVTPFTRERTIDFDRYAQLIEFHLPTAPTDWRSRCTRANP